MIALGDSQCEENGLKDAYVLYIHSLVLGREGVVEVHVDVLLEGLRDSEEDGGCRWRKEDAALALERETGSTGPPPQGVGGMWGVLLEYACEVGWTTGDSSILLGVTVAANVEGALPPFLLLLLLPVIGVVLVAVLIQTGTTFLFTECKRLTFFAFSKADMMDFTTEERT